MAIIRFEPFREADALRYRLDKLFDGIDATRVPSWTRQESWLPRIEISETDELVRLRIALPGLDRNDIDVHVSQRSVLIEGEHRQAESQETERLISSEFLYGKFRRVIVLDTKVKNNEAAAEMRDGMLTLTIPKADEERERLFQVKLSEPQTAESVKVS